MILYGLRSKINGNLLTMPLTNSHAQAFEHNRPQYAVGYTSRGRAVQVGAVCFQGQTTLVRMHSDEFGKITLIEG